MASPVPAEEGLQCLDCFWLLEEGAVDVEAGERGQVEAGEQLEALAADEAAGCVRGGVPRLSSSRRELKRPSARKRRWRSSMLVWPRFSTRRRPKKALSNIARTIRCVNTGLARN